MSRPPAPGTDRLLDHAIWWHVYPLGAVGAPAVLEGDPADATVEHRLPRLEAWLDEAVGLGCSGLLLGPVFASRSHGYDTLDHSRVDPRLGDEADLDHLLEQCRERGLSVLLDGVFNHVGADHPMVSDPHTSSMLKQGDDGRPASWEGHEGLVELDHGHPGVAGAEAIATVVSRVMLSGESTQGLSPEPPCAQFVAPDGP